MEYVTDIWRISIESAEKAYGNVAKIFVKNGHIEEPLIKPAPPPPVKICVSVVVANDHVLIE